MTGQELVGQRIKAIRRQRGLSQAQLAHPELSDSYVSLIESGKRTPTPAVLELLAQKLDCSLTYLVNGVTAEQMQEIELGLGYARLALENGEVVEARNRFAELLSGGALAGLARLRQDAEYGLALAIEACGDQAGSIAVLERLRADDLPPERHVGVAIALSRCHRDRGDLAAAVEVGERILTGAVRPSWTDELVELGATLLSVYLARGDLLRARQFSAELLSAAETLGSPRAVVAASWNSALVAEAVGRAEDSLALAERALAVQSENGEPRNLARMRLAFASLQARIPSQNVEDVRGLMLRAERELAQTSASTVDRARCALELASVELRLGQADRAADYAKSAQHMLTEANRSLGADSHLLLGRAYSALGRGDEAAGELRGVRDLLTQLPLSRRTAQTWYAAAETMESFGDHEGSVDAYRRALACAGL
ncbi:Helix-turn-helix [Sinosporangium album]|uniref:Helix-turn-helix n=1 Tax=Sinosporangium album TaxID=504805 RepID=A0A1G7SFE1_9ACTN|nr:helix-turn-helix transcriptional regulator [Sinosporangium album]SDG21632.1 Helix-turn-helix [Sinosporangium album]